MQTCDEPPLVSCVMPTYNRRKFVPLAIRYFQRQEHPNKELIIVDDGTDCIEDLVPAQSDIKYIRLNGKITLGEKLNIACRNASGSIVANWDDDDWYAPRRLQYQVNELLKNNTEVCGINQLLYYDLSNNQAYEYKYPADQRKWLLGSSLCYLRSRWENNPFENINVGMDGLFVWRTSSSLVTVLADPTMSVHMIHEANVCAKKTSGEWWHQYPVKNIEQIMRADLEFYYEDKVAVLEEEAGSKNIYIEPESQKKPVSNIYACLVHEQLDCVIDMVRNLHFHDPSSTIILFNGGVNFQLNAFHFPFEDFGAVIHPLAHPVQHGYLHNFALECMQFALDNYSFDILTVVDSDQLSIRPNYSEYMSAFLSGKTNIGLLSNRPERLTEKNTDVWTSIKPYQEYDLWKPLLKTFPNGEDKFLHWSFWPSTVFTYSAISDLVKLFKTNTELQYIMQRTQIWATEEIILPTLIALLGYDIALNPCCADYVNYQKTYSESELTNAFTNPDVFWVHPVSRKYDDAIRKQTRKTLNNYAQISISSESKKASLPIFYPPQTLNDIELIEGWLSQAEAELLIAITLKACYEFKAAQLVEIGSYHGKATVILGKIAQSVSGQIKVHAIDKHDGLLGSADQGLHSVEPSLEKFTSNIENAGLSQTVIPIVAAAGQVKWDQPISLLLIDGLHDYLHVSADFRHFASFIEPLGFVAFHDYADYYPDVMAFVNELLAKGRFQKIQLTDSLMVLRKVA